VSKFLDVVIPSPLQPRTPRGEDGEDSAVYGFLVSNWR